MGKDLFKHYEINQLEFNKIYRETLERAIKGPSGLFQAIIDLYNEGKKIEACLVSILIGALLEIRDKDGTLLRSFFSFLEFAELAVESAEYVYSSTVDVLDGFVESGWLDEQKVKQLMIIGILKSMAGEIMPITLGVAQLN